MKQSNSLGCALVVLTLALPAAYACGDDDLVEGDDVQNTIDASTTRDATAQSDSSSDAPVATLSDAEIGGVLSTVNQGEISQGQLAQERAQTSAAQEFGADMVTMHTAAQARQDAVLQALGLTTMDSATSQQLQSDAAAATAQLQALDGLDFDAAYLQAQVTQHAKVLQVIDDVLLPSVTANELRAELQTTRSEVSMHHEHAIELLAALGADGGSTDSGAADASADDGGDASDAGL